MKNNNSPNSLEVAFLLPKDIAAELLLQLSPDVIAGKPKDYDGSLTHLRFDPATVDFVWQALKFSGEVAGSILLGVVSNWLYDKLKSTRSADNKPCPALVRFRSGDQLLLDPDSPKTLEELKRTLLEFGFELEDPFEPGKNA